MNRRTFVAGLALTVSAVLGLAGPLAAGKQVPFKGNLDGTVAITPLTPPFVSVAIDATGNATHLGQFTLSVPHTVNREFRTASGTYTFVAANGDTLTAEFTGQSSPSSTPGVLSIVENATITGGTGRFAHASGSFTTERLFDTVAGTTSGTFSGTVSSTGSGKR
jgi:hypothetical protein